AEAVRWLEAQRDVYAQLGRDVMPEYIDACIEATVANRQNSEELERRNAILERARGIIESAQTEEERRAVQIGQLNEALALGGMTQQKYDETVKRLNEDTKAATGIATDFSRAISTGFEDAIIQGKGLQDVMKGLLEDINRIILRVTVMKPFEQFLTSMLEGKGAPKNNIWSIIFGFLPTAVSLGSGAAATGTTGAATTGTALGGGLRTAHARGAIVTGPVDILSSGGYGVMGENGFEGIMPLARDASGNLGVRSGGGGGVVIQVIDQRRSGAKIEATENSGIIRLIVRDEMASDYGRSMVSNHVDRELKRAGPLRSMMKG
ncbi:MAG: hypothetical protein V2A34_06610, partial [Lentisphaerota bacterium]